MGTDGLWGYICKHGLCTRPRGDGGGRNGGPIMKPDHLMVEMNALVYSTISGSKFTSETVVKHVIASVQRLVRLLPPSQTLALVFDGVAPVAKIPIQKERRAGLPTLSSSSSLLSSSSSDAATRLEYNHDYIGKEVVLAREEVISGSEFLLACEDALRALMVNGSLGAGACGKGPGGFRTIISGCEEAGEGELKISSIIREIWIRQTREGTYTGDDVIVVVGNDSDLALVGIACTPYREFYMVSPTEFVITGISKLFEHWLKDVSKERRHSELLSSYRIDFVFLMLLAGGDWYTGIGRDATCLWRQYRELRLEQTFCKRPLISGESFTVDVELLRAVMNVKAPSHNVRNVSKMKQFLAKKASSLSPGTVNDGVELLKGAMWALKSIIFGRCFDYDFCVFPKNPTISALKAAAHLKGIAARVQPESAAPLPLLAPLEHCLAVMGKRGRFSPEIWRALTTVNADGGKKLTQSCTTAYLVSQVRLLMDHVDRDQLTPAELRLLKTHHRAVCEEDGTEQSAVTFMSYEYKPQAA